MDRIVTIGNAVAPYASILTIASFIITVINLIIATRINKRVKKSDYRKNIQDHVDALVGCCATLRNDQTIVKDELFDDIWEHLDTIDIVYAEVIGRKLSKKVKDLKEYISSDEARKPENFSLGARRLSTFAKELKDRGEKF